MSFRDWKIRTKISVLVAILLLAMVALGVNGIFKTMTQSAQAVTELARQTQELQSLISQMQAEGSQLALN
jgi:type II secretory pathway component PulJ